MKHSTHKSTARGREQTITRRQIRGVKAGHTTNRNGRKVTS